MQNEFVKKSNSPGYEWHNRCLYYFEICDSLEDAHSGYRGFVFWEDKQEFNKLFLALVESTLSIQDAEEFCRFCKGVGGTHKECKIAVESYAPLRISSELEVMGVFRISSEDKPYDLTGFFDFLGESLYFSY